MKHLFNRSVKEIMTSKSKFVFALESADNYPSATEQVESTIDESKNSLSDLKNIVESNESAEKEPPYAKDVKEIQSLVRNSEMAVRVTDGLMLEIDNPDQAGQKISYYIGHGFHDGNIEISVGSNAYVVNALNNAFFKSINTNGEYNKVDHPTELVQFSRHIGVLLKDLKEGLSRQKNKPQYHTGLIWEDEKYDDVPKHVENFNEKPYANSASSVAKKVVQNFLKKNPNLDGALQYSAEVEDPNGGSTAYLEVKINPRNGDKTLEVKFKDDDTKKDTQYVFVWENGKLSSVEKTENGAKKIVLDDNIAKVMKDIDSAMK